MDSNDAINSNIDDAIGGGEVSGDENKNHQTTGVMLMMVTGRLRGNDDVEDVQPSLPNTQQLGRGQQR